MNPIIINIAMSNSTSVITIRYACDVLCINAINYITYVQHFTYDSDEYRAMYETRDIVYTKDNLESIAHYYGSIIDNNTHYLTRSVPLPLRPFVSWLMSACES